MKSSTHKSQIGVFALLGLASCVVGGDEPRLSSSLKAITSAKWATCWVRPDAETNPALRMDTVECNAQLAKGPFSPTTAAVNVLTATGNSTAVHLVADADTVVARVQPADYPLTIELSSLIDTRDFGGTISLGSGGLKAVVTIPRADAFTSEKRLVIEQPVDVWPIEIASKSEIFIPSIAAYDVALPAGVVVSETQKKLVVAANRSVIVRRGNDVRFYVIVTRGAKVRLTGTAQVDKPGAKPHPKFEIDGPGKYVGSDDGLKRVTETDDGLGTTTTKLDTCPGSWSDDGVCDRCLSADPDCAANNTPSCEEQWRGDGICDACLGSDPDCAAGAECPASWRGDGICDECLGNDSDCAQAEECPAYWRDDGVCDPCLGNDADCTANILCPIAWRADGMCDVCLGDDPDCEDAQCPAEWRGDGVCDACLVDDPDCAAASCPAEWRDDGVCDECLGDDPDCTYCPMEWYGDGLCDECLVNDPDCESGEQCPWSWYDDGVCDPCLGDDPDCVD